MARFGPKPLLLAMLVAVLLTGACIAQSEDPNRADTVRFGLFADLHAHDTDSPLEGKWMTHTEERLSKFIDAMNTWNPDFVIELGDFINGWVVLGEDPGPEERIPEIFAWAESLYARFDGPRYHVIGNHDIYNLDKREYREMAGIEETAYSFHVGTYHFVVLDVQFSTDGSDLANTFTGVSGFVPETELAWLQSELASTDAPTIVFVHQMLDRYIEAWGRPLIANQRAVQSILEEDGDVIAVFQGHDHENAHQSVAGIHYVTFEALVDQDTPASWAQVTLDPASRSIRIDGVGDQTSWMLSYGADH